MRWDGDDLQVWWSWVNAEGYEVTRETNGVSHGSTDAGRTNAAVSGSDKTDTHVIRNYSKRGDGKSPTSMTIWWPAASANVDASVSDDDVTLTWNAVAGATKYRYRVQKGSDAWSGWAEASNGVVIANLERGSANTPSRWRRKRPSTPAVAASGARSRVLRARPSRRRGRSHDAPLNPQDGAGYADAEPLTACGEKPPQAVSRHTLGGTC